MDNVKKVLKMIEEDTRKDVRYYEGKSFTGRNVAEYFGKISASIVALTNCLNTIIDKVEEDKNILDKTMYC
jgi:hypothetical protein